MSSKKKIENNRIYVYVVVIVEVKYNFDWEKIGNLSAAM